MQELPFLRSTRSLMLIDICMKFREDSFRGFQVTERTRFVTDRQTDGRTDRRPGKNNVSQPFGGRHKYQRTNAHLISWPSKEQNIQNLEKNMVNK